MHHTDVVDSDIRPAMEYGAVVGVVVIVGVRNTLCDVDEKDCIWMKAQKVDEWGVMSRLRLMNLLEWLVG